MSKLYDIHLAQNKIGTTGLEKADVPMGAVFGTILFSNIPSGYEFIKNYCLKNEVPFDDDPENKLMSTVNIPELKIYDADKNHIKGISCNIYGMDAEGFEVCILGIEYPFYEEEFPHHVKAYKDNR